MKGERTSGGRVNWGPLQQNCLDRPIIWDAALRYARGFGKPVAKTVHHCHESTRDLRTADVNPSRERMRGSLMCVAIRTRRSLRALYGCRKLANCPVATGGITAKQGEA